MGNMSYCRFRNTLNDLRDCEEHFGDTLDGEEAEARQKIYALCQKIVNRYDADELAENVVEDEVEDEEEVNNDD